MRGKFITFEGGECAGKSTQAEMLASWLKDQGINVLLTREPGGTPLAENLRSKLLSGNEPLDSRTEALLFAAARADHVAKVIEPALAAGIWVICDRFVDSSRAYQGVGQGPLSDEDVMTLHRIGSNGLLPDLTFVLDVPPEVAAERAAARDAGNADKIGGRSAEFHEQVRTNFLTAAEEDPNRFMVLAANKPIGVINGNVQGAANNLRFA